MVEIALLLTLAPLVIAVGFAFVRGRAMRRANIESHEEMFVRWLAKQLRRKPPKDWPN